MSRFLRFGLLLLLVLAALAFAIYKSEPAPTPYPVEMTLYDKRGRALEAAILGKKGNMIVVKKIADGSLHLMSLAQLSEKSSYKVSRFTDARYDYYARIVEQKEKVKGHIAFWYTDFENAKVEARNTGLPILVAFLTSQGGVSKEFSMYHLESREFRKWAHENAVLCLAYKDPDKPGAVRIDTELDLGNGLNALSAEEGRELARALGVHETPVIIIADDKGKRIGEYQFSEGNSASETVREIAAKFESARPTPELVERTFLEKINDFFYGIKAFLLRYTAFAR